MKQIMFFRLAEITSKEDVCSYCKNPANYKVKAETTFVCSTTCLVKIFENKICDALLGIWKVL